MMIEFMLIVDAINDRATILFPVSEALIEVGIILINQ